MEHIAIVRIRIETCCANRTREGGLEINAQGDVTVFQHRAGQGELLSFADTDDLGSESHGQHTGIIRR